MPLPIAVAAELLLGLAEPGELGGTSEFEEERKRIESPSSDRGKILAAAIIKKAGGKKPSSSKIVDVIDELGEFAPFDELDEIKIPDESIKEALAEQAVANADEVARKRQIAKALQGAKESDILKGAKEVKPSTARKLLRSAGIGLRRLGTAGKITAGGLGVLGGIGLTKALTDKTEDPEADDIESLLKRKRELLIKKRRLLIRQMNEQRK